MWAIVLTVWVLMVPNGGGTLIPAANETLTVTISPALDERTEGLIPEADTLVICPDAFTPALERWITYRESQGHVIRVLPPPRSAYDLRTLVQNEAKSGGLRNLVLVGDVGGKVNHVPIDYRKAKVNVLFGSEPEIATDNSFADLDGDRIPDLAVGRLPVDSAVELDKFVTRVIDYETSRDFSDWRRRINVVAGVGGFDPVTDKLIEHSTSTMISQFLPGGYPLSMTYGSWSSPYCPAPERFGETAVARFNEGCLFWVYTGHGHRHGLDSVYTPKGRYSILDNRTVDRLSSTAGSPIAVMLCCYSGAVDDPEDCLAENMLKQPKGPIAVLSGSRVTMPYAMSILSLELMSEHFNGNSATLGELFTRAKRRMVEPDQEWVTHEMRTNIEQLGLALSPTAELLQDELVEHLDLFMLVGDPLLRIAKPAELALNVEQVLSDEGVQVQVSGNAPFSGELVLEVCYARHRFRNRPLFRKESELSDRGNDKFHSDYEKHQNLVCTAQKVTVASGTFSININVPPENHGEVVVRGYLTSGEGYAIGSQASELPRTKRR